MNGEENGEMSYLNDIAIPDYRFKRLPSPKVSQAERVVNKFGGPNRLSKILKLVGAYKNPVTIYRWMYPKNRRGTGGLIPSHVWPYIYLAARLEGVLLTQEDTDPREMSRSEYEKSLGIR